MNKTVCGREADAWFEEERVIVELDSYGFRSDRETFESDRDNDAEALAHGILTVRLTWRRIHGQPEREAARLNAILEQRRRRAA